MVRRRHIDTVAHKMVKSNDPVDKRIVKLLELRCHHSSKPSTLDTISYVSVKERKTSSFFSALSGTNNSRARTF